MSALPSTCVSLRRTPLNDASQLADGRPSTLSKPVGLALLPTAAPRVGTEIEIDIRGRAAEARVVEPPFYRTKKEVPE